MNEGRAGGTDGTGSEAQPRPITTVSAASEMGPASRVVCSVMRAKAKDSSARANKQTGRGQDAAVVAGWSPQPRVAAEGHMGETATRRADGEEEDEDGG